MISQDTFRFASVRFSAILLVLLSMLVDVMHIGNNYLFTPSFFACALIAYTFFESNRIFTFGLWLFGTAFISGPFISHEGFMIYAIILLLVLMAKELMVFRWYWSCALSAVFVFVVYAFFAPNLYQFTPGAIMAEALAAGFYTAASFVIFTYLSRRKRLIFA